jgi:hypothetical protein
MPEHRRILDKHYINTIFFWQQQPTFYIARLTNTGVFKFPLAGEARLAI